MISLNEWKGNANTNFYDINTNTNTNTRMGKSVGMLTGQAEPTIIQPPQYRKRFTAAVERYFMSVPDKWVPHSIQSNQETSNEREN